MRASIRSMLYGLWKGSLVYRREDFKSCGERVIISPGCTILSPERVVIGDEVFINQGCVLYAGGSLSIGRGVVLGTHVTIMTTYHNFDSPDLKSFPFDERDGLKSVSVGEFAWIGSHAIVLPGVTIGRCSVVGAGSVVTDDVEEFSVVAGNPARFIRKRENQNCSSCTPSWVGRCRPNDPHIVR